MADTRTYPGLAARMGRWSAAHWKTATFGWLAFVAVAFALGGAVGTTNAQSSLPALGGVFMQVFAGIGIGTFRMRCRVSSWG